MASPFWKKYEFFIVAALTLLFIYIVVIFNQNINFLLGNDLIVNLIPQQKSFNMNYGNVSKAEFDVSIGNVFYCRAACSYSFNDRSRNEVIGNGNFEIERQEHFAKSYELGVKRLGSGQDIYSFDVECHSIRSFLCLTTSPKKSKSSLAIVNYDLTETEKELKKLLRQNVTQLLELLAGTDVLHQQVNQKYFELAYKVNLNNLSRQKIAIDDSYDKVRISIENLRSLWSVENYFELNNMFSQSFFHALKTIKNSIAILDNDINSIVDLHNSLLLKLNFLHNQLIELANFASLSDDNEANNEAFADLNVSVHNLNKLASLLANNTFGSYGEISDKMENLSRHKESIIQKTMNPAAELFLNSEYLLGYGNDYLCSLKQDCGNTSGTSALKIAKNAEQFIKNYPDAKSFRQNCNLLEELEQKYSATRNDTLKIISNKSISYTLDNNFLALVESFNDDEIRKINNSYYDSLQEIISGNKTSNDIINMLSALLPSNKTEIMPLDYNESINISLYLLSTINPSNDTLKLINKCSKLNAQHEIGIENPNFVLVSKNITYKPISRIDTNLSDNPPICCIFKDCKPCCMDNSCINDPKTFPVIFLHGHSFYKDNSPEFSLDSFNQLQAKLQEDGYLNVGIISLYSKNEPLQEGIWGLSGKPVSVKASYYYDAFRKEDKYIVVPTKSENIDTYALRLKELIDMTKKRANKPKVNVIAHSMGGLVARRYLQIFGEDDINKLVMVSTPNRGISSAISNYCGLIGENRECGDMQENSLFLNKLNEPLNQPARVKLYALIGQGCLMEINGVGSDGDGIVVSENAKLENAKMYFISGTCSKLFGESLHTEILNIEKYPETYRIIKEILKG